MCARRPVLLSLSHSVSPYISLKLHLVQSLVKQKKRIPRSCEILCCFFLSGAAHSRMKLPGFPGSCNYVVNSLRQLVETLDPSPEYTYCHLFYEVVAIISFGTWKVYGQSFSKSRHIFVTITDFRMSYVLFLYNSNTLFQKSQMSFSIFLDLSLDFQFHLTCASKYS